VDTIAVELNADSWWTVDNEAKDSETNQHCFFGFFDVFRTRAKEFVLLEIWQQWQENERSKCIVSLVVDEMTGSW
jgi:hypothetical protein